MPTMGSLLAFGVGFLVLAVGAGLGLAAFLAAIFFQGMAAPLILR